MRKLFFFALAAGALLPSFAHAQPVSYTFRFQEVANASKATAQTASNNEYAQFGVQAFAGTLANDVSNKKCDIAPGVQSLFKKVVLPILTGVAKAGVLAGDSIYGDGTIVLDLSRGVIDGGIITTADTSLQTSGTATLVTTDYENLGAQSLLCGGASNSSGPGTCGAVCASAGPKCLNEGGAPKVTGLGGGGYVRTFVYPLANAPEQFSLCTGATTLTWAECCGDPNLVVVGHVHITFTSDHSRVFGTVTDEEAAGSFEGQQ